MTISPVRPPRRARLVRRSPQPTGRIRTSTVQQAAIDQTTRSLAVHVHILVNHSAPVGLEHQIATGLHLAAERLSSLPGAAPGGPAGELGSVSPSAIDGSDAPSGRGVVIRSGLRQVWSDGAAVALTPKEYELLVFLARHPDQIWTRHALSQRLWSTDRHSGRTIDVHVHRLRAKLSDALILTSRQVGYRINPACLISIVEPISETR